MTPATVRTLLTAALIPAVAACSAASGSETDVALPYADDPIPAGGATASDVPSPQDSPSATWYIGHSVGMSALSSLGGPELHAEDFTSGAPVANATFCSLEAINVLCATTDLLGAVALGDNLGAVALVSVSHADYAPALVTVDGTSDSFDAGLPSYRLHSEDSLAAIYAAAGVERDPSAATVLLEVIDDKPHGVEVSALTGGGAATIAYAGNDGLIDTRLEATSGDGSVYLLNVQPGSVRVAFTKDTASCAPVASWSADEAGHLETTAAGGMVTFGGFVSCR